MLSSGWPKPKITKLWLAVCGLSILAAGLGYGLAQILQRETVLFLVLGFGVALAMTLAQLG